MRIYISLFFLLPGFVIPISVFAQKISGRVLNEGGKGARHVTVRFKDKSTAVITNTDGRFIITAKNLPDTLFFSAPGYEPYKVLATEETAKDTNFYIVLLSTRSKTKMSEVVVTKSADK